MEELKIKNYTVSVDTMISIKAKTEDEMITKATAKFIEMLENGQIEFVAEEDE